MKTKPISVLLVEDDADDVTLTREALRESKLQIDLVAVDNGEKALTYLRQEGSYSQASRPDLILLDLNLPRKNGWEVLSALKSDPQLKVIPVTILTTSNQDPDIQRAYEHGVNSYVTKPIGIDQFRHVVKTLEDFWFTIVKLPPQPQQ